MRKRMILPFAAGMFLSSYVLALALLVLICRSEPEHTLLDALTSFLGEDSLAFVFIINLCGIMLCAGTASGLAWDPKAEQAYKHLRACRGDNNLFWFLLGLAIPQAYGISLLCVGLVSWGLAYFFPARGGCVFVLMTGLLALVLLEETPAIVFRLVGHAADNGRIRVRDLLVGSLILGLLVLGTWGLALGFIYGFIKPEPIPYREKVALKYQLRFAKVLKEGMPTNSWKTTIDEPRRVRAIELLSNGKLDEAALFLYAAVAHHPVWGYMAKLIFVDERASVSEVAYSFPSQKVAKSEDRLTFFAAGHIYGQQRNYGYVLSEVVLRASDDVAQGTISDANTYEPEYLLLPKAAYQSLIAGLGEMLLVDDNGNVLDSISITITDFKYRGAEKTPTQPHRAADNVPRRQARQKDGG
ncbi:MAG: hypothetical protein ACYSUV_20915 [Planctomycetota bacterium]